MAGAIIALSKKVNDKQIKIVPPDPLKSFFSFKKKFCDPEKSSVFTRFFFIYLPFNFISLYESVDTAKINNIP